MAARESGLIAQVVAVPIRAGGVVGVAVRLDEQGRTGRRREDMSAVCRPGNDRLRPSAEHQIHLADPVHHDRRDGAVSGPLQVVAGDRLQQGARPRAGLGEQGAQRCVARARQRGFQLTAGCVSQAQGRVESDEGIELVGAAHEADESLLDLRHWWLSVLGQGQSPDAVDHRAADRVGNAAALRRDGDMENTG